MNSEKLKEIEEIYHAVLEIPIDERESFFSEHCGEDENLRREVESLLSFEKTSDKLIDTSPESVAAAMFAELEPNSPLINKEIGHYNIKKLLGKGGMGEVYLAQDSKLNRKVALKLLPPELTDEKDRLKRFVREAQAVSALNHPNILTIHEFGTEGNHHFIVMEFVEGVTLREKMAGGQMSINEALNVAVQVASALSAAHETGIIHRDIKPDNIMIRRDGIAKVLDFGLVKLTETNNNIHRTDSNAATRPHFQTNPGALMGSANYMSPEQARSSDVDARTDIFSLGVVLYEMLAGQKPFVGDSPVETMNAIIKDEPPDLAEINAKISPALKKHCSHLSREKNRASISFGTRLRLCPRSGFIKLVGFMAGQSISRCGPCKNRDNEAPPVPRLVSRDRLRRTCRCRPTLRMATARQAKGAAYISSVKFSARSGLSGGFCSRRPDGCI